PVVAAVDRRVHVRERQHRAEPAVTAVLESAFAAKFARVAKRAEQNVPRWEVCEVVVMHAQAMMDTVRLGPLNEITQPLRRAHVPMLEVTIQDEQITD